MSSRELVAHHEEANEFGGYFLVNGNERLIRYLIVAKANSPQAIERPSFEKRGPSYSNKAVVIRCLHKEDLISVTNAVHYLHNGGLTLRFSWRKQEYMVPVVMVLKALVDATDKEIFASIVQGDFENTFLTDRVELLLRNFKQYSLWSGHQCLEYLGSKFRVVLGCPETGPMRRSEASSSTASSSSTSTVLGKVQDAHLHDPEALLARRRESCADNADSPQHHEILMPGFLVGQIIKERIDEAVGNVRAQIARDVRMKVKGLDFYDTRYIKKTVSKVNIDIGVKIASFLATGNLSSPSGLDLQQTSVSPSCREAQLCALPRPFPFVHRGAFFAELKTTSVRKLLPEAWGFLCPVHTPDVRRVVC